MNKLDLGLSFNDEGIGSVPREDLKLLLNQSFKYLNQGTQSYVFESEDGSAVIKLFRSKSRLLGFKSGPIFNRQRIDKTFRACQLAYSLAREETALLYVHLHPTRGQEPTIKIQGPMGLTYDLQLDRYSYVIQKKAEPFKSTLQEALREKRGGPLIDSYLSLIQSRIQKGICNTDLYLTKNFGFLEGRAVEIDFGNYIYAPEQRKEEFVRCTSKMRSFLQKYSPESLEEYDRKVEALR